MAHAADRVGNLWLCPMPIGTAAGSNVEVLHGFNFKSRTAKGAPPRCLLGLRCCSATLSAPLPSCPSTARMAAMANMVNMRLYDILGVPPAPVRRS